MKSRGEAKFLVQCCSLIPRSPDKNNNFACHNYHLPSQPNYHHGSLVLPVDPSKFNNRPRYGSHLHRRSSVRSRLPPPRRFPAGVPLPRRGFCKGQDPHQVLLRGQPPLRRRTTGHRARPRHRGHAPGRPRTRRSRGGVLWGAAGMPSCCLSR